MEKRAKKNIKQYHDWVQVEAGGVFPDSWSFKKCRRCGAVVTHFYQKESFSEALKREGLSEFCEGETKQTNQTNFPSRKLKK